MEVDSVVASKSHPIELEVVFGIGNIYGARDVFSKAKSIIPVQAPTLAKIKTHYDGMIDLTFSSTIVKNRLKAPMVRTGMEGEASISIQLELIVVLTTIAPRSSIALEDVGLDVREEVIDVTKVMTMEE
jgi:hypothetical protein